MLSVFWRKKNKKSTAWGILSVILIAFALKAVIPAGFMPSFEKDGSYQLVVCSGTTIKTITVDSDPFHKDHKENATAVCDYQAMAFSQALTPVKIAFVPAPVLPLPFPAMRKERIASQIAASLFLARGPPAA